MKIKVPYSKLEEIAEASSVGQIAESKPVKSVMYQSKTLVVTGTSSSGDKGWISATAFDVIPLQEYVKSGQKPVAATYHESNNLVNRGDRDRGYKGIIVTCKGGKMVLCNEYYFESDVTSGEQLQIF